MKLVREKNEKYKDKRSDKFLYSDKLATVLEVDSNLINGKSVEEVYSSIYKNPSKEIQFINDSRANILLLQRSFPLMDEMLAI
jgi:hypothetical protein